jgi:hypothetical protein
LVESDFVGATSVAANAFEKNNEISSITSITLPTTVKSIGTNAFYGSDNISTISALGVTTIDDRAFNQMLGIIPGGIKLTYSETIKPGNATL